MTSTHVCFQFGFPHTNMMTLKNLWFLCVQVFSLGCRTHIHESGYLNDPCLHAFIVLLACLNQVSIHSEEILLGIDIQDRDDAGKDESIGKWVCLHAFISAFTHCFISLVASLSLYAMNKYVYLHEAKGDIAIEVFKIINSFLLICFAVQEISIFFVICSIEYSSIFFFFFLAL